jgi:thioredoxin-like negative regulator of GroEL
MVWVVARLTLAVDLTEENRFEMLELSNTRPVLLFFYTDWCRP